MSAGAIHLGSDHRGFTLRTRLAGWLAERGWKVADHGCPSEAPSDYPDAAFSVARAVAAQPGALGVLICSNGVGMSMAANKVRGVRAALCVTPAMARQSRRHNDANLLALGADLAPAEEQERILAAWLEASFEGGRHARRVEKMMRGEC
jgi:ribose 5-phosphate isomerase B